MKGRANEVRVFAARCLTSFAAISLAGSVSASASVTVKDLVELTDIDSLSTSPDGQFAAFRTERADIGRNTYVLRWHSVDLATGIVRDIGSAGDPIYGDPGILYPEKVLWARDGRSIIVRALIDRAIGLWRADVGGQGITPLVIGDADIVDFSTTPDRTAVEYTVGASRDEIRRAERHEYDSGILVDKTIDLSQNLSRGGSINGRMASQRLVGYWWVRDGLLWRAPRQRRRIDLETGNDVALGDPRPTPPFDPIKVTQRVSPADRNGDVVTSSETGDKHSISVTFKDGRKVSCVDPRCASSSVSSLVWRPRANDVIVTFKDRELRQSIFDWNVNTNRMRAITSTEGLLNGGRFDYTPCALSESAAICVASGPASPPRLESVDLATGKRKILFDPNVELRAAYRPEIRFLRWNIGGGLEAGGVLMLPSRRPRTPVPLYINYYRCEGFLRGGMGDEWPIPQLLETGYAVACINSVPFSGPQDGIRNYEVALTAVRALIEKLSNESVIDPSKVAMGGLSFGSEVTLWVAMHSNLLAAVSISSGQQEPGQYWLGAMPGSDIPEIRRKVWGIGAPDETPERWKITSPALNADKIRAPVLFQLPEQEARSVPELYSRLYRTGTPTELYAFPDEDHLKIQPRHRKIVYERNLDWFRYWLQDFRDPDPAKVDQYRRWDGLKERWKRSTTPSATTEARAPGQPSR